MRVVGRYLDREVWLLHRVVAVHSSWLRNIGWWKFFDVVFCRDRETAMREHLGNNLLFKYLLGMVTKQKAAELLSAA